MRSSEGEVTVTVTEQGHGNGVGKRHEDPTGFEREQELES